MYPHEPYQTVQSTGTDSNDFQFDVHERVNLHCINEIKSSGSAFFSTNSDSEFISSYFENKIEK